MSSNGQTWRDKTLRIVQLPSEWRRRIGPDAPKIVFRVEDANAVREELLARGVEVGKLRADVPGKLICDGVDPEGNKFAIESEAS